MSNETKTKQIETQEDLQKALMKYIGPVGGLFVTRELRCSFKGNNINQKERWSIYARKPHNGNDFIVGIEECSSAQKIYDRAVKEFESMVSAPDRKADLYGMANCDCEA